MLADRKSANVYPKNRKQSNGEFYYGNIKVR